MQEPANAVAAASNADPYPYYARLRAERPFCFDESSNLWVAANYAAVAEAFVHPLLRVRPPSEPVPKALLGGAAGEVFALLVRMTDGEFHARHKPAVTQSARRWDMAGIDATARVIAGRLKRTLRPDAFLTELPVQTMAGLLGMQDEDAQAQTSRHVHAFTEGIAAGASASQIAAAHGAAAALMAQGARAGLEPVRAANRIALMQQSLDATAGLIGNTALLLRARPELMAPMARFEPARALVSEVARWDAPVQNTRRFAAEDLVLQGVAVKAGQGVLLLLASANRDAALNPDPDTFDPERANRRSMTFGAGAHQCPGELLAVAIAAAAGYGDDYFPQAVGYRALPNARIPVFMNDKKEQ